MYFIDPKLKHYAVAAVKTIQKRNYTVITRKVKWICTTNKQEKDLQKAFSWSEARCYEAFEQRLYCRWCSIWLRFLQTCFDWLMWQLNKETLGKLKNWQQSKEAKGKLMCVQFAPTETCPQRSSPTIITLQILEKQFFVYSFQSKQEFCLFHRLEKIQRVTVWLLPEVQRAATSPSYYVVRQHDNFSLSPDL